ncbi:hypothetical protein ANO11243_025130 [Dothideomycetidae sp. 11243]|nr:hypothetical protein ANO11243_025130 [fungal sp. No.11243]
MRTLDQQALAVGPSKRLSALFSGRTTVGVMTWLSIFSPTVSVLIAIVLVACYSLYRALLPKPLPGIPYSRDAARSVMGDVKAMSKDLKTSHLNYVEWITAQSSKLDSSIYQLFFPLSRPVVILTDHREILDVLSRRGKEFDRSMNFAQIFRGTMRHAFVAMRTSDPQFRPQKRLLADTMSQTFLVDVAAKHIYEHSLLLVNLWRTKSRIAHGRPFAVQEDIRQVALDALWAVSFGTGLGSIEAQCVALENSDFSLDPSVHNDTAVDLPHAELPASAAAVRMLINDINGLNLAFLPNLHHWLIRRLPRWQRARAAKDKLMEDSLNNAKARLLSPESREDMVTCATDHMVFREHQAAQRENRRPQYDSRAAKDDLFAFLFAGHDAPSATLQWGVKLLADHPTVQSDLRSALHRAFPNDTLPSGAAIAKADIPYLDATIEEILRVGRPGPGQIREALCDTELLGYAIPKGTEIFLMSNGPGYVGPDTFKGHIAEKDRSLSSQAAKDKTPLDWEATDIAAFEPKRWLKPDGRGSMTFDPNAGPVQQFGAGVRGCFGRKLGYLELRILITVLVWHFDFPKLPEALSSYARGNQYAKQVFARPVPLAVGEVKRA